MPPVRARWVAAKPLGELLGRTRAGFGIEHLTVFQPCLEIIGRGLDHHSRLETLRLHPLECFSTKVINETQSMNAGRPDVNMSALAVFVTQPLDGCFDIESSLPFLENHLAGVALDTEVEMIAAHRAKLYAYQPLDDNSGFLAALFALGFCHLDSWPNLTYNLK